MIENPLERVHTARSLLGQAREVDEIDRLITDPQEQVRLYARESSDARDCEIYAGEIQVRATRQTGLRLMAEQPTAGRPAEGKSPLEGGISPKVREKARKLAAMPESEFETRVKELVEGKKAPTVGALLNEKHWEKVPKPEKTKLEKAVDAMHAWERVFVEADPEEALQVLLFPSGDADMMDIVDGRLARIEHQIQAIRAAMAQGRKHPFRVVQRGA
jgi:hypothetical protein